jgi:putative membrane protein
MKLPELKRRFKNRYAIRIIAGVLTVTLLGSGMTAVAVKAGQRTGTPAAVEQIAKTDKDTENDNNKNNDDTDSDLSDLISIEANDDEIGKEESVYLMTDATGAVRETIVSEHLINDSEAKTITDASTLSDIKNVKGDETFSQDGEKLTWQADGSDIYYQGTTSEEAPVSQQVTYYLDGEEIAPEELAGKSGEVTIRFDYTNNSSYTETVNGSEQEVKVPFAAVTAMVLGDNFSHIKVTNGKLENNGDNTIVIGYALPGIKESLGVEDSDFIEDIDLPEYFEVTADVTDFELDTAMTVVANAGDLVSMKTGDDSSLEDMMDELSDASKDLKSGSKELADGMDTLQSSLADYASGMSELNDGSSDLGKGVDTLNSSAKSLSDGIKKLDKALNTKMTKKEQEAAQEAASKVVAQEFENGKTEEVANQIYQSLRYTQTEDGTVADGTLYSSLYDGAYSSNAASAVYDEVVRQVLLSAAGQDATSTLTADQVAQAIMNGYAQKAKAGDATATAMYGVANGMSSAQLAELLYAKSGATDTLFNKTQSTIQAQLSAGRNNEQISAAVEKSLKTLATQLAGACQSVAAQAAGSGAVTGAESAKATIASQIEAVQDNGYSLVTGAAALSVGTQSLADQVPTLTAGITALNDATLKLVSGVDELDDGSHELSDGMVEFDEEGISKIINSYRGDIKPLTDRMQAMLDAGADYQTFTAIADDVNGSVKFIYKMDSIKADEDAEEAAE